MKHMLCFVCEAVTDFTTQCDTLVVPGRQRHTESTAGPDAFKRHLGLVGAGLVSCDW